MKCLNIFLASFTVFIISGVIINEVFFWKDHYFRYNVTVTYQSGEKDNLHIVPTTESTIDAYMVVKDGCLYSGIYNIGICGVRTININSIDTIYTE